MLSVAGALSACGGGSGGGSGSGGSRSSGSASGGSSTPPAADAGADLVVPDESPVVLDGSQSNDPDGSITTFLWTQLSGPSVRLADATRSELEFITPDTHDEQRLTFELTVTDNDGLTDRDQVAVTVVHHVKGQVKLGPIENATVEFFAADTLAPLFSTITDASADLSRSGIVHVDPDVLLDELYLVRVTEGVDVDANDDSTRDAEPTPLRGELHGLLTRDQVLAENWRVSVLSELAYDDVWWLLATGAGLAEIQAGLDESARRLISEDITGDGIVNHDDLAVWDAVADRHVFSGEAEELEDMSFALLGGNRARDPLQAFQRAPVLEYTNGEEGLSALGRRFDIVDGIAYVGTFSSTDRRVYVLDVSSPPAGGAELITDFVLPGTGSAILDIDVEEGLLAGVVSNTVSLFDVSDPENLSLLGLISNPSTRSTAIAGDILLVGGGASVQLYDISDPRDPQFLSSVPTGGINDIIVEGRLAYVMQHNALSIIDFSDPSSPSEIIQTITASFSSETAAALNGTLLYFVDDEGGLRIYDVSDPADPEIVGELEILLDPFGAAVIGDALLVASTANGAPPVIDISDPTQPRVRASTDFFNRGDIQQVGDHVAVGDLPLKLLPMSSLEVHPAYASYFPGPPIPVVLAAGDMAYVATPRELRAVDYSDVSSPLELDNVAVAANARALAASGNRLALLSDEVALELFDVSDPANLVSIGGIDVPARGGDLAMSADALFLGANELTALADQVQIFDLLTGVLIGIIPTEGDVRQMALLDNLLLIADSPTSGEGVLLVDVSDPELPRITSRTGGSRIANGMDRFGSILYTIDGFSMLRSFDISNPASPILLDELTIAPDVALSDVAAVGDYVFVLGGDTPLLVLDASKPDQLEIMRSVDAPALWRLEKNVDRNLIYAADRDGGVYALPLPVRAVP